ILQYCCTNNTFNTVLMHFASMLIKHLVVDSFDIEMVINKSAAVQAAVTVINWTRGDKSAEKLGPNEKVYALRTNDISSNYELSKRAKWRAVQRRTCPLKLRSYSGLRDRLEPCGR